MGDAFAPDAGQHVDANGRVTYDFDGHVHAQGLDIDAGTGSANRVQWLLEDGALVAYINGDGSPTHGVLQLAAREPDTGLLSLMSLFAQAGAAAINLDVGPDEIASLLLLNSAGASSFVQQGPEQRVRRVLDAGRAAISFPGGSPAATAVDVAHTLGVEPIAVVLTQDEDLTWCDLDYDSANTDDATFRVHARTDGNVVVGAHTGHFAWIAIG